MISNQEEAGCEEDTNAWANLWSDEQKNHIRLCLRLRLHYKANSNNYTQSHLINEVYGWRGRND